MTLPKQVRIGSILYKVEAEDGLTEKAEGSTGYCNNVRAVIGIEASLSDDTAHEVLVHEVVEAINYQLQLGMTHAQISGVAFLLADIAL